QIAVADVDGYEGAFALTVSGLSEAPMLAPNFAIRLGNGTFQMLITGSPGQSFGIQASTNLVDWQTIGIDTLIASSIAWFADQDAPLFPQRFYRVLPLDIILNPTTLSTAVIPAAYGEAVTVRVIGSPGLPFSLRASSDMEHWEEFARGLLSTESLDFIDGNSLIYPVRFYQSIPLH
ncbi:MAG: hypothetical protein JWM16_4839, partial [Verrucomicrobiales bacterium]|nr:hypothetical protein [Verrucomicrobiales bacterium]